MLFTPSNSIEYIVVTAQKAPYIALREAAYSLTVGRSVGHFYQRSPQIEYILCVFYRICSIREPYNSIHLLRCMYIPTNRIYSGRMMYSKEPYTSFHLLHAVCASGFCHDSGGGGGGGAPPLFLGGVNGVG